MSARRDLRAAQEDNADLRAALAEAGRAIADRDERLNILTRQHSEASARIIRQETESRRAGQHPNRTDSERNPTS